MPNPVPDDGQRAEPPGAAGADRERAGTTRGNAAACGAATAAAGGLMAPAGSG
ncbi:MAG: hypothetical protein VKJ44_02825 [Synechococcus sp.]|nr:hypothetical protein [Synechococcus sp.]